jgi:hypothetical protein
MTIRQTRYQAIAAGFAHGKNLQRCMTMFASVQILQSRTCNLSLSMNNNSKHRRPQSLRGRMQHLAEAMARGETHVGQKCSWTLSGQVKQPIQADTCFAEPPGNSGINICRYPIHPLSL